MDVRCVLNFFIVFGSIKNTCSALKTMHTHRVDRKCHQLSCVSFWLWRWRQKKYLRHIEHGALCTVHRAYCKMKHRPIRLMFIWTTLSFFRYRIDLDRSGFFHFLRLETYSSLFFSLSHSFAIITTIEKKLHLKEQKKWTITDFTD